MSETVPALLAELAALEDPRSRAVNERHGVNLTPLRAVAKRVKTLLDTIEARMKRAPERLRGP